MFKSHNLVVLDQIAANSEIETLKEENRLQSLGKKLYEYLVAHNFFLTNFKKAVSFYK